MLCVLPTFKLFEKMIFFFYGIINIIGAEIYHYYAERTITEL
jgi:hypothetical protein